MFTFRSSTSIFLIPFCFSSVILAQQVVDDNKAGSSHDAEEQAYALLLESCNAAPNIDAQLMNEHGMLQAIQDRLMKELIRPESLSSPDEDWTAEDWISTARVYERIGQLRKSHDALSKALHLVRKTKGADFGRGMTLQRIATGLARHGDFERAAEAATSIEIVGDDQFHITEAGPVQVAADAHRSYVLLVLTSMQTRIAGKAPAAARYNAVAELVESIPNETVRSVALWVMALRQAENGDTEAAIQTIQAVNALDIDRLTSKVGPTITEFTTRGPNPVPWSVYRTVSLEQVALHLSLKGDDAAAAGLVNQVTDAWLKDNVQLEVACGLLQEGRFEAAKRWVVRIESLDVRSRADGYIVLSQIRAGELHRAEQSISQVADVGRRSELRLQLVEKLLDRDDRMAAEGHLQIVRNSIGDVDSPDAGLLYALGSVEARAGNHEKAVMALLAAGKASDAIEPSTDRIIALARIAALLASADAPKESADMFDQATKLARSLDAIERGYSSKQIGLALVEVGRTQAAEDLVLSIDHAASRGDALGALGSKYAERGDVKTSRARFSAAFEVALKIDVPMGLDTAYSKGGAIRILARKQAIVDMPGLQEYLRAAKSPNIRAYGYLGAAEGLAPMAAERASARGLEYPQGLFYEIWNQRATMTIHGSD